MVLPESLELPISPRLPGITVPLTAHQLQIWNKVLHQGTVLSSLRLIVTSVHITGPLNTKLLSRTMESLIQRHESLRTRIVAIDGTPTQQIDDELSLPLQCIDLRRNSPKDARALARIKVQEFIQARTDVSVGPLFEGHLLRVCDDQHVMVLAIDHMVSDAASCEILNREIWSLYAQAERGDSASLPDVRVQFADYAVWQQGTATRWSEINEPYWRLHLLGAPATLLPRDHNLNHGTPTTATLHYPLGKFCTERMREIATEERIRLSTVALALYVVVLSRWLNQRDILLTFVSHGRHRAELRGTVGLIADHLLLRVEIQHQDKFRDLLRRVDLELNSAYKHYDFGRAFTMFPECVTEVGFNWLAGSKTDALGHKYPACNLKILPFPTRVPWPISFTVIFSETPCGIVATVGFRTDLFSKSTAERIGRQLQLLAEECGERHYLI